MRIPAQIRLGDVAPPEFVGMTGLEDKRIHIYLPSLTLAPEGGLERGGAVMKVKARYETTGVMHRRVCPAKEALNCDTGYLILEGYKAYLTRYVIDHVGTVDMWCVPSPPVGAAHCAYPEADKTKVASSDPDRSPFMPYLPNSWDTTHRGWVMTAREPIDVDSTQPVDFGEDMTLLLIFEDFDRKEADLHLFVQGLGGTSYVGPVVLPRAPDGSVSLYGGDEIITLKPGKDNRSAIVTRQSSR